MVEDRSDKGCGEILQRNEGDHGRKEKGCALKATEVQVVTCACDDGFRGEVCPGGQLVHGHMDMRRRRYLKGTGTCESPGS